MVSEDPNHRLLRHVVCLLAVACDQDERAEELPMLGLEERLEGRSTCHVRPFAGRSIDHPLMKHLARRVRDALSSPQRRSREAEKRLPRSSQLSWCVELGRKVTLRP